MFLQLLSVGIAAALTENMVFGRALGYELQRSGEKDFANQMQAGILITLFTIAASACGWLGRFLSETLFTLLSWTRPALYMAVYGVVMVVVMLFFYEYTATRTKKARQLSARLVYGFIPVGTLFIVGNSAFTFWEAIFYGMGSGGGYLLALVINYSLQKRLTHSDVPQPFRGMPATLLSYGMISLALFGLLGHQLVA